MNNDIRSLIQEVWYKNFDIENFEIIGSGWQIDHAPVDEGQEQIVIYIRSLIYELWYKKFDTRSLI